MFHVAVVTEDVTIYTAKKIVTQSIYQIHWWGPWIGIGRLQQSAESLLFEDDNHSVLGY